MIIKYTLWGPMEDRGVSTGKAPRICVPGNILSPKPSVECCVGLSPATA